MNRFVLILCAAIALGGCAGGSGSPGRPAQLANAPTANAITSGNETALYLDIVDGLVKEQHYGAAVAFLDDYSIKDKDLNGRYWLLRGDALLGLGRPTDAATAFAKLNDTPLAAEGWNGKGRAAAARSQWRDAAANFQQAVKDEPANPDFLNDLAFASMHLGQSARSVTYLRQALELKSDSDVIRNNLLIALTLSGDQRSVDAILQSVGDAAQRERMKAVVESAIRYNNLAGSGKS